MARFNLDSPTGISKCCDLDDLDGWVANELHSIGNIAIRSVVRRVCKDLPQFVEFPARAILLWRGCNRVPEEGQRQKYHRYPDDLRGLARECKISLDTRPNGPAIASFLVAGGKRPTRLGSSNAWSIHHVYSGKYPYLNESSTTHSTRHGLHFTQSAGLVAVHPIADAICDEFPFFSWLLRAKAFCRYGYDPDCVFAKTQDKFGFSADNSCEVVSG